MGSFFNLPKAYWEIQIGVDAELSHLLGKLRVAFYAEELSQSAKHAVDGLIRLVTFGGIRLR